MYRPYRYRFCSNLDELKALPRRASSLVRPGLDAELRQTAVRMSQPQLWCAKCLNDEYDMVDYPRTHNAKQFITVPQSYVERYEREQAAAKKKARRKQKR